MACIHHLWKSSCTRISAPLYCEFKKEEEFWRGHSEKVEPASLPANASSLWNAASQGTDDTILFSGYQSRSQHYSFMSIKFSFERERERSKLSSKSNETFINDHLWVSQWKEVYGPLSISKHSPVDTTAGPRAEEMENSLAAYWIQRKTGTSPTCAALGAGFLFTCQHQMATLSANLKTGRGASS